LTDKGVI